MAKKSFRYQHIYSVVDGKAPSATTLLEGEIAVNAFADNEKLFIKNSSGDVVDFPRSYSIKDIDEDMEIIAAALNELNDRKADWVSAVTSGAVDDDSNLEFYNRSGQTLFEIEIPGGNGDELTIHSGKDAQDKPIVSTLIYIKDVSSSSGETLPANVQKRYRLVDANGDNIVTASGDTSDAIDIYKDSSVVGAYIGTSGDSVDSGTGVVTKLEVGQDWSGATSGGKVSKADFHFLNYIYFDGGFSGATISGDGEYKLVNVDLGQATAGVYGSGVTMTEDGAVTGVVDSASSVVVTEYTDSGDSATTEEVLTVGEDGFKVEHIQEAIDAKADIWRRLYHVTSGKARTDIVESATTLEYYNLSGDTLFQVELPIDNKLDSGSTNPVQNSAITKVIIDDEKVMAAALNDLNDRKADWISAVTNGAVIETESASTMEFYNISGDTLFTMPFPEGGDVDMDFDSGSTKALANSAITVTLEEMQKVTSAALNDLNMRKLDISAHTLFDEQLFVANGEFVESSTTAVFKNLSGDTLFEIPAGGGKCDTDPELDSGSTNPVANSAITLALEDKMDKQDFMTQLYPQGSVYITYEYKNPGEFLGGEWELIGGEDADKNYYPAFAINTDTAGTTIDESLPNIKGSVALRSAWTTFAAAGAFTSSGVYQDADTETGAASARGTAVFEARTGQANAAGTGFVPASASTYQNGAQVNVNAIKLFFWRRTDSGVIIGTFSGITVTDDIESGNTLPVTSNAVALETEKKLDKVNFLNQIYPQGAIYITETNTNPSTFIGGQWELVNVNGKKTTLWSGSTSTGSQTLTLTNNLDEFDLIEFQVVVGEWLETFITSPDNFVSSSYNYIMGGAWDGGSKFFSFYKLTTTATNSLKIYQVSNLTLKNISGINLGLEGSSQFVWKRTDDAPIEMSLKPVTLEIQKDVLWSGDTGSGTITLSGSIDDYDQIEISVLADNTYKLVYLFERDKLVNNTLIPVSWESSNRHVHFTNVASTSLTFGVGNCRVTMVRGIKDAYVSRTDITTEINSGSTDDKAASAKAVYDALNEIEFIEKYVTVNGGGEGSYSGTITCNPDEVPLGRGATTIQVNGAVGWGWVDRITKNSDTSYTFGGWRNANGGSSITIHAVFVKMPMKKR